MFCRYHMLAVSRTLHGHDAIVCAGLNAVLDLPESCPINSCFNQKSTSAQIDILAVGVYIVLV
jgi:hypothetical protein